VNLFFAKRRALDLSTKNHQQYPHAKFCSTLIVKRLEAEAEKARAQLGDTLTKRAGAGTREPGRAEAD